MVIIEFLIYGSKLVGIERVFFIHDLGALIVEYFFFHAFTEMVTFFLKRGKKIPFLGYTRKMSVRRFDRDKFALIVGFHNDEVGCPYFQIFATNLPFRPLDGDT